MSLDRVKNNTVSASFTRQLSNGNGNMNNMPGPIARQMSNTSAHSYSDDNDDTSSSDEESNAPLVANGVDDTSTATKKPLNYHTYLHLDQILNGVHCLSHVDPSDEHSRPVHDEHFFIIIHQLFELWFKAFLFEIDSIREIFMNSSNVVPQLFYVNLRLQRSVGIWNMLIDMLQKLETMTPVEFLAFRDYVTPASGFQSLQFRIIEIKLGLTDPFRRSYKVQYFTKTMFKNKQSHQLKKAIKEQSLLVLVQKWLEHVYDSTTSFQFLDLFTSAVKHFIEHTKNQKVANGVDIETAEKEMEKMKRQFSSILDPDEYEKLLASGERRMSQNAMLAAVMISLYHRQPCFQQSYEMLNLLMDVDSLISSWRYKHVLLVQRQIGRKPGTGGTDGFSYLQQTISEKYQVFIDLFNVSSYLIPQHFLPKFFGQLAEPANLLSSIHLKPSPQVSIIRFNKRSKPKHRSTSIVIDYQQVLFYLFLFVAGTIFSILINSRSSLF